LTAAAAAAAAADAAGPSTVCAAITSVNDQMPKAFMFWHIAL
jgi:hypothetical protein